jgi:DNA polymerase III alpha subunit (gram-positive type)
MTKEIYFSIDMESDGPCPGLNSMLSLAAVAVRENGEVLGTWTANLATLPEASSSASAMQFWSRFPKAYEATRQLVQEPADAMIDFVNWVDSWQGVPVAVAFPAGFDFTWVYYYTHRFVGRCPFSHSAVDMKTLAWCYMGGNYRHATKRNWPRRWFNHQLPHTHVALDDAQEQAQTFLNMLKDIRQSQSGID